MKRLVAFLFVGSLIFALSCFGNFDLLGHDKISKVCVVTNYQVVSAECDNVIKSGNQFYYSGSRDEIKKQFKNLDNVDGVILYFQNSSLKEVADFYKIDYYRGGDVEGMSIYYGYSPYYKDFENINNKKLNVQIAINGEEIIVGFPAILIGF